MAASGGGCSKSSVFRVFFFLFYRRLNETRNNNNNNNTKKPRAVFYFVVFPLKYVNGGPTEEVISKATRVGYFGCDSGKAHPTCGLQYYGLSDPVPYSEVNRAAGPVLTSAPDRVWPAVFFFFLQGFCCSCLDSVNAARQPRVAYGAHRTVADDPQPDDVGVKLRGDPDCRNLSESPSYANPFTYHESSHCFRYDDLWSVRSTGQCKTPPSR